MGLGVCVVAVHDVVVDVVGQIRIPAASGEVGEEQRGEAGEVAGEGAGDQIDLEIRDGVEVRLAPAERAELRETR